MKSKGSQINTNNLEDSPQSKYGRKGSPPSKLTRNQKIKGDIYTYKGETGIFSEKIWNIGSKMPESY